MLLFYVFSLSLSLSLSLTVSVFFFILSDHTRDLVKVLKELLSVNLDRSGRFLLLHNEAGEEVGESARVAVGMTHGLVEACMQVSEDGNKMVEETKKKIEAIKKQVDLLESQITKSGIL